MRSQDATAFELFPPQTPEGLEKLRVTRKQLAQLNPAFFSVTFGAGGSTRDRTLGVALEIQAEGQQAAPHISCVASTRASIREMLQRYRDAGITAHRRVARRPAFRHGGRRRVPLRQRAGGLHPGRSSARRSTSRWPAIRSITRRRAPPQDDFANFKRKVEAGADTAITQYFYNPDAYFAFVDECEAAGHHHPDRSGHHAHRQVCAARALLRRVRRGDSRAGSAASSRASVTTPHRSARSVWTS